MDGYIENESYIIGDGIITYYKNGIYTNYEITQLNEINRKIKQDTI
jgi:hypothetical protein